MLMPSRFGQGASRATAPAFRLTVDSGGRFVRNVGAPFPLILDSAWWANTNLQPSDQATYLADRQAKGFNCTLLNALEHSGTINKPPLDFASNLPFTKRLDGATFTGSPNGTTAVGGNIGQYPADNYSSVSTQSPDFTYPNAAFFARAKTFVDLCASYGQAVCMFALYYGFAGTDEGWVAEMLANDALTGAGGLAGQGYANAAKSQLWNYGAYLATTFAACPNIIWVHGGDATVTGSSKTAVDNVRLGMQSITSALSKLDCAHWARGTQASAVTGLTSGAFALNAIYTGNTDTASLAQTAYGDALGPLMTIENRYDLESSGSQPFRQYLWPTVCSGAAGSCYGNSGGHPPNPLYDFDTGWATQLNSQCALDAKRLHGFMRERPWWRMKPSGVAGAGTIITANGGTANTSNYVAAAIDSSASCLYCYVPPAWSLTTLTVDLSLLSSGGGNAVCRWFDPTSGAFTAIGTYATSGTHVFTPPGSNSEGSFTDWILLCEASP